MAYTKDVWNNGDPTTPLSAARLSHMETQHDAAVNEVAAQISGTSNGPVKTAMAAYVPGTGGSGGTISAASLTQFGFRPNVLFNGVVWESRASKIPTGYLGNVVFDSTGYTGAIAPTDMIAGDKWERQVS